MIQNEAFYWRKDVMSLVKDVFPQITVHISLLDISLLFIFHLNDGKV